MNQQKIKPYGMTSEEKILKETFHNFSKNELRPSAAVYDKQFEPESRMPRKELEKALSPNGLGLGMAFVPVEYGGAGYGMREQALIAEELAWGDLGFVYTAMGNMHSAPAIADFGSEAQKSASLPAIAGVDSPGILVAAALTEPNTGSNIFSTAAKSGIQTSAVLDGDHYILNGKKCFINNAGRAELYMIWARTEPNDNLPEGGISVFLAPADTPGLTIGKIEDLMGIRTAQLAEVYLENCRIPAENLLGQEGAGVQAAMATVPVVMTLMGAAAVGLAQAALESARDYASQRITEKSPINQYQAVSHKLVDMDMQVEALRSLVWRSACLHDEGSPDYKLSLMCKLSGSETAQAVTADAVQIIGAYGYSREFPVEKYMRDAKSLQVNGPDMVMRNHLSLFI